MHSVPDQRQDSRSLGTLNENVCLYSKIITVKYLQPRSYHRECDGEANLHLDDCEDDGKLIRATLIV